MESEMQRIILHVDLDAFFASVEEAKDQKLKGKPLVVGADPKNGHGRGVVSTANYEARKYGVHSAQPISIAWRKLQGTDAVFLPVNMELYVEKSMEIMSMFRKHADSFEQTSVDEAYLDVSSKGSYEKAQEIARKMQEELINAQNITCSIGISSNKMVSKIAADIKKPNGLTIVKPKQTQAFLDHLSVRDLPGIGPKTEEVLNSYGIKTIEDLRTYPSKKLGEIFGKHALGMQSMAHGIDESPVMESYEIKSVGRQYTFQHDTSDEHKLFRAMQELIKDSFSNLHAEGFKSYRTVTIKIRFSNFETHTTSRTLKEPHSDLSTALTLSMDLLRPWLEEGRKIRLIGISFSKLE